MHNLYMRQQIFHFSLFTFHFFFVPLQPNFKGCLRLRAEMIPSNLIRIMPA